MGDESRRGDAGRDERGPRPVSALEIVASGTGLLLTLAMLAFIGWEALTRPGDVPPAVTVEARQVTQGEGVWVLEFEATNHTPVTAANVRILGTLSRDGGEVESGEAVLDYVPGGSSVRGGLFFSADPRGFEVELRALGYSDP
jgi:uncharacterized protein (TIGR02588 family)